MSEADISKATARPWRVAEDDVAEIYSPVGGMVADCYGEMAANAALIVLAVNSYDAMLAALHELLARDTGLWTPAIERARAAIRIAEGEETP